MTTKLEQARSEHERAIREGELEIEIRERLEGVVPEPRLIHLHAIRSGYGDVTLAYKVDDLREAKNLIRSFFIYLVDGEERKQDHYRSVFSSLANPKKGDIRNECVSFLMTTSKPLEQYPAETEIEFFVQLPNMPKEAATVEVSIKLKNSPCRITEHHTHSGKTRDSQIVRYDYRFFGLETGTIDRYSIEGSFFSPPSVVFREWYYGITDEHELDQIFPTTNETNEVRA